MRNTNAILYGFLAGIGLLAFYILIVSLFQDLELAFLNLRILWYLIFPLVIGFGIQVGLYFSIRHDAYTTTSVATSGGVSAGSMIACCSHFILNLIPLAGFSALSLFLVKYQKSFLEFGIIANVLGIIFLLNHKKKMKGGKC